MALNQPESGRRGLGRKSGASCHTFDLSAQCQAFELGTEICCAPNTYTPQWAAEHYGSVSRFPGDLQAIEGLRFMPIFDHLWPVASDAACHSTNLSMVENTQEMATISRHGTACESTLRLLRSPQHRSLISTELSFYIASISSHRPSYRPESKLWPRQPSSP